MGVLMIVRADGTTKTDTLRRVPSLRELQAMVGGPIEVVPHVDLVSVGESSHDRKTRIVALCNEEGKLLGLPINQLATDMWRRSQRGFQIDDVLVGSVVFIWGDQSFMDQL